MGKKGTIAAAKLVVIGICLVLLSVAQEGTAKEIDGVSFPDEIKVHGEVCRLIGVGLREKFFFDIYYGGLYLVKPTHDPKQVVESDQAKCVDMQVVYKEIEAKQWVDGWKEGFAITAPHPGTELAAKIEQFLKCFSESTKKGDRVTVSYFPGTGTEVNFKGKTMEPIKGHDFMVALWNIWFGEKPVSKSLKKGMLGL